MSRRNWLDPDWRHKLTNALIVGSVVAIFGVIGTAANSYMTKASPALYVFLGGGAFIGLLVGGALYLIVNKGSPTSEALSASASPWPASPSPTPTATATATPAGSDLSQRVANLENEVKRLKADSAKSPTVDRSGEIAALKDEYDQLSKKREDLTKLDKETLDNQELTLQSLEEGSQRHADAVELETRQKENAAQQRVIEQQQAAQRDDEMERKFANRYAPIGGYVITTLHEKLSKIAKAASEPMFTDFPGDRPSIFNSEILRDGKFQKGKQHVIRVGSHKEWEVIVTGPSDDTPIAHRSFQFSISAGRRDPMRRSTDWYSLVTVSTVLNDSTPVTTEPVKMNVQCFERHGAFSQTVLYSESCTESDYHKHIQAAIGALIQDRYNARKLGADTSPTSPSSTPSKGASPPSPAL